MRECFANPGRSPELPYLWPSFVHERRIFPLFTRVRGRGILRSSPSHQPYRPKDCPGGPWIENGNIVGYKANVELTFMLEE